MRTAPMTTLLFLGISLFSLLPAFGALVGSEGARSSFQVPEGPYVIEKDGFRYLQVKGSPDEIGYQHGSALSDLVERSISGYAHATELWYNIDWRSARLQAMTYWPYVPEEQRQEIDGITRGAAGKGAKNYLGDTVDRWDILALNAIWDIWWRRSPPGNAWWWLPGGAELPNVPSSHPHHCSGFVATGNVTADGGFVLSQSLWMPYFLAPAHAVFIDIIPDQGNRILMEVTAGMIWSGTEYYISSAGLVVAETTLGVGHYKWGGTPSFVRLRKAIQYADSIDSYTEIMLSQTNGAYCGDYLIADAETNEVAVLELGSDKWAIKRTKNGYLQSCNYPWDSEVAEEMGEPQGWDHGCYPRWARWDQLLQRDEGNVTAFKGMEYLGDHYDTVDNKIAPSGRTLCGHVENASGFPHGSIDAKSTNRTMTLRMETLARYGHSCGQPFLVEDQEKNNPDYVYDDLIDIIPCRVASFSAFSSLEVKAIERSGRPVPGARVSIASVVDGTTYNGTTSADGTLTFSLIPNSEYVLEASTSDLRGSSRFVQREDGQVEVVLGEGASGGGIIGGKGTTIMMIVVLLTAAVLGIVLLSRRTSNKSK